MSRKRSSELLQFCFNLELLANHENNSFSQYHIFTKSWCVIQRHTQNPVKRLGWSVLRKQFRKTLHFKYLRELWIRLWYMWHKFSICVLTQMKRKHIPIKVWSFSLTTSRLQNRLQTISKMSLKLPSRINLGRQSARAPSYRLRTKLISSPAFWIKQ